MTATSIVMGSPEWLVPAAGLIGVGAVLVVLSYVRSRGPRAVSVACAALKVAGLAALALCLVEPLLTGSRPQPGANVFVVLVDNSQSLNVRGGPTERTGADWARGLLDARAGWRTRLGQDFDTRGFVFDTHLRGVDDFEDLRFDGTTSSLHGALSSLAKRYQGRPLAGVLLVSDGNATDAAELDIAGLPPVYPVIPPDSAAAKDLALRQVTLNQTNFEAAPVAIRAEVTIRGFRGQSVVATVAEEAGKEVARQELSPTADDETLTVTFQVRPDKAGVAFYRVRVRAANESADGPTAEQTLANNDRLVVVDRGGGPYRVLYVSGRPNWEFKYLRRAVDDDAEVQLVGLIRVARREPKFDFRSPKSSPNNPLFRGFDHPDDATAERRDQPVLIRLNTKDEVELRGGFPPSAADLYRYHAVILDDIEAAFFTPDQQLLLRNFVSQRGGGFLMLGGPDSFEAGKYDRTPVGDLLPVYLGETAATAPVAGDHRLVLTRDGWLQPWVRTKVTEIEENARLNAMAPFHTVNTAGLAKPGATVLAQVTDAAGQTRPALVSQPFGKGRSAALLIGDLWRWGLRRENAKEDDFERSWRQTVRWLVADVPGRVDARATPTIGTATPAIDVSVRATDAEFGPLDNATVTVRVTRPNGTDLTLTAEPDAVEAGRYGAKFVPREPGPYRAVATVTAPDGSVVGRREIGWCVQPEAEEFARLRPNRELLESLAARTKGHIVSAEGLAEFVANLQSQSAPNMEAWVTPLWHRGGYFFVALACLVAEWGLRRRFGMA